MSPDDIETSETLYRAFKAKFLPEGPEGNLSSQALFDSRGLSCDRDGGRLESHCCRYLLIRMPEQGIFKVKADDCYNCQTSPKPNPLPENMYHAIITDNSDKFEIPREKRRALIKSCRVIHQPNNDRP